MSEAPSFWLVFKNVGVGSKNWIELQTAVKAAFDELPEIQTRPTFQVGEPTQTAQRDFPSEKLSPGSWALLASLVAADSVGVPMIHHQGPPPSMGF